METVTAVARLNMPLVDCCAVHSLSFAARTSRALSYRSFSTLRTTLQVLLPTNVASKSVHAIHGMIKTGHPCPRTSAVAASLRQSCFLPFSCLGTGESFANSITARRCGQRGWDLSLVERCFSVQEESLRSYRNVSHAASMAFAAPRLRPGARKLASVTPDILSYGTDGIHASGPVKTATSMIAGAAPKTIFSSKATRKLRPSGLGHWSILSSSAASNVHRFD